jgi:methionine synthase II (cobalamin-independent)
MFASPDLNLLHEIKLRIAWPSPSAIAALSLALKAVQADRLWVNPDCGLKTRGYAETEPALRNLVAAARQARGTVAG